MATKSNRIRVPDGKRNTKVTYSFTTDLDDNSRKMVLTDDQFRYLWRMCESKPVQLQIFADLNGVSRDEIGKYLIQLELIADWNEYQSLLKQAKYTKKFRAD